MSRLDPDSLGFWDAAGSTPIPDTAHLSHRFNEECCHIMQKTARILIEDRMISHCEHQREPIVDFAPPAPLAFPVKFIGIA